MGKMPKGMKPLKGRKKLVHVYTQAEYSDAKRYKKPGHQIIFHKSGSMPSARRSGKGVLVPGKGGKNNRLWKEYSVNMDAALKKNDQQNIREQRLHLARNDGKYKKGVIATSMRKLMGMGKYTSRENDKTVIKKESFLTWKKAMKERAQSSVTVHYGVREIDAAKIMKKYGMEVFDRKALDTGSFIKVSRRSVDVRFNGRTLKAYKHTVRWAVGSDGKTPLIYEKMADKAKKAREDRRKGFSSLVGLKYEEVVANFPNGASYHNYRFHPTGKVQMIGQAAVIKEVVERKINPWLYKDIANATLQARDALLAEMDAIKGWRNLTGNAYTGIVAAAWVTTGNKGVFGQTALDGKNPYAQMPGVGGRRATRGKLNHSNARKRYKKPSTVKTHKVRGAHVFMGRYFDNPSKDFIVTDHGQFMPTSGNYAYDEAKKLLAYSFDAGKMASSSHYSAMLKVEFGAIEYLYRLKTRSGGSLVTYAEQRAPEILREYLRKNLKGKFK